MVIRVEKKVGWGSGTMNTIQERRRCGFSLVPYQRRKPCDYSALHDIAPSQKAFLIKNGKHSWFLYNIPHPW